MESSINKISGRINLVKNKLQHLELVDKKLNEEKASITQLNDFEGEIGS